MELNLSNNYISIIEELGNGLSKIISLKQLILDLHNNKISIIEGLGNGLSKMISL